VATSPDQIDAPPAGIPQAVDATAGRLAAGAFGLASLIRRRRIFHPDGIAFEGAVHVDPDGLHGARLLDEPGEHRCVLRISRGVGLPDGRPDVLGVAVRVEGQDLLFATVLAATGAGRHVLAPARSFADRPLSTILPYRTRDGLVVLTLRSREPDARGLQTLEASAKAIETGRLTFALGAGSSTVGHLSATRRLSAEESEALRFNPFHAADDLQPAGGLNALRRRAYKASQAARSR
jgi:hypothetical protein